MSSRVVIAILILATVGCVTDRDGAATAPPDSIRQPVEAAVQDLNTMRESLAATIDTPSVGRTTFTRVCAPVGKRAKKMAQTHHWTVQQLARKYRNPAHQLDPEADSVYSHFVQNPAQTTAWIRTVRDGATGWRYFRRITVQPSCLACHGPKEKRPDFVKDGYPEDRAYGFETGDLRGLYAVFVPDSTVGAHEGADP